MEALPQDQEEVGGAGGAFTFQSLLQRDAAWKRLRTMPTGAAAGPSPEFVKRHQGQKWEAALGEAEAVAVAAEGVYDVAVCGGTLGIFVAAALAKKGLRVVVLERGTVQGRAQEWNISRKELQELLDLGVLKDQQQLEDMIAVEFNPNRCGFKGGQEVWVSDILNLGVSPKRLVQAARECFEEHGGVVLENTALGGLNVYDNGVVLGVGGRPPVVARLVLDAMGNFSPIVQQIRWGRKPDGVCLVVGGCARGFPEDRNTTSDVIYTDTDLVTVGQSPCQFFWEAFPAGSGPSDRTTYLFTYMDAEPGRPSLLELMEEYWDRMPPYQGVKLEQLQFLRVLFGFFPTYRDSPLETPFDRILQVGDASGIQSPLSFGGFGSITRHLHRISTALQDALAADLLTKESLSRINPYQPNLSGAWLLQRAMAPPLGTAPPPPGFINALLSSNFNAMQRLGDPVLRPFLQDVTQFSPLALTMGSMVVSSPGLLPDIIKLVGVGAIADWLVHFVALGSYTAAASALDPLLRNWVESLPPSEKYAWSRRLEAWKYGSGLDYKL